MNITVPAMPGGYAERQARTEDFSERACKILRIHLFGRINLEDRLVTQREKSKNSVFVDLLVTI